MPKQEGVHLTEADTYSHISQEGRGSDPPTGLPFCSGTVASITFDIQGAWLTTNVELCPNWVKGREGPAAVGENTSVPWFCLSGLVLCQAAGQLPSLLQLVHACMSAGKEQLQRSGLLGSLAGEVERPLVLYAWMQLCPGLDPLVLTLRKWQWTRRAASDGGGPSKPLLWGDPRNQEKLGLHEHKGQRWDQDWQSDQPPRLPSEEGHGAEATPAMAGSCTELSDHLTVVNGWMEVQLHERPCACCPCCAVKTPEALLVHQGPDQGLRMRVCGKVQPSGPTSGSGECQTEPAHLHTKQGQVSHSWVCQVQAPGSVRALGPSGHSQPVVSDRERMCPLPCRWPRLRRESRSALLTAQLDKQLLQTTTSGNGFTHQKLTDMGVPVFRAAGFMA
ncbi:hypothetical protein TREES_T100001950 [Tupaia chinensis]|uniref:Uncharacterized protein n=1 Tax=Tupaia chinensis TaxID=246437 RepID=L9JCC5_TUPCH|nr:hypothetical protein TREES_T100001950 [Tupaia chinensis]